MGPLTGYKVIEMVGLGPGPFCAMMLADMGAEVIRVDKIGGNFLVSRPKDVLGRGRPSLAVNLKDPKGVETVLELVEQADALIEGFRPGVMERLGLGPDECLARNPKLVYGRMTGWGQEGPMAQAAGHDINYIALGGALHAIGRKGEKPVPPLNLVGDFGGGGMFLAYGIVCALLESQKSGEGQVVDAAMVDGTATLTGMFFSMQQTGMWNDERGTNMLDTGSHYYDTYETSDGKWISLGSMEPQFYAELLEKTGVDPALFTPQHDASKWDACRAELERVFKTKTRDQWCEIMEGTDVCFAPVLSLAEAPYHPHMEARNTFIDVDGIKQPAPAPRFSRTPGEVSHGTHPPGVDSVEVLSNWGFSAERIAALQTDGVIPAE